MNEWLTQQTLMLKHTHIQTKQLSVAYVILFLMSQICKNDDVDDDNEYVVEALQWSDEIDDVQ